MSEQSFGRPAGAPQLETGYPGLDIVRFGAAVMIALYHLTYVAIARAGPEAERLVVAFAPARWLTGSFWVGVPVFFVLSGIVIAFSADGRSAGAFVRRRALRLYPAAWICATITLLVWPHPGAAERYLRSVALFPAGPWVSDVYWTLAVEITFYAMVALALLAGGGRWVARLGAGLALLSAGWWGLRILNVMLGEVLRPLVEGLRVADAYLLLDYGCYFALGILVYGCFAKRREWPASPALIGLALLTCLAALYSNARGFVPAGSAPGANMLLAPALWLAAVAVMLVSLSRAGRVRPSPALLRRVRWIGLATYPLYLVHAEVGVALMLRMPGLPPLAVLAATFAALFLLVAAIMAGEEGIRRLIAGRPSPPAPVPDPIGP